MTLTDETGRAANLSFGSEATTLERSPRPARGAPSSREAADVTRRGRPKGQPRSHGTHLHHRFRRPARREQPADGVHWVHYPPTMRVIADPTRTGARHTSKYFLPTPPGRWGQDGGGEKYPPCRSLISDQQNQTKSNHYKNTLRIP